MAGGNTKKMAKEDSIKVGDKIKHRGDNSTGVVKEITDDGYIIWVKDEDGFDEKSMLRYIEKVSPKMAEGGKMETFVYTIGGL